MLVGMKVVPEYCGYYTGWAKKRVTPFKYINIIPCKLQNTRYLYCVNNLNLWYQLFTIYDIAFS